MNGQDKGSFQAQASSSNEALKKNDFYALLSTGEQETLRDDATGMLKVLSIYVYALLDPDATLSIVTPLVAKSLTFFPIYCMNLL